jgi:chromosome segregation ATPase
MTLAEQLAEAAAGALRRRQTALTLVRKRLLDERDELLRTANLPSDADALERRQTELEREIDVLKCRVAELEEMRERLTTTYEQKLHAAWARAVSLCGVEIERWEQSRLENSFNEAVNAFREELAGKRVDLTRATPAQLRQHLPYLQMLAESLRARARQILKDAAERLGEAPQYVIRHTELEAKRRQLDQELETVYARLRAHQNSDDLHLFNDLESADVQVVRRIRREVLQPLLNDARIERQHGLAGSDPLDELGNVSSP